MANYTTPNNINYGSSNYPDTPSGPFLATVIGHLDSKYMGRLKVLIQRQGSGNKDTTGQTRTVDYMSPFMGSTSYDFVTETNDYDNTQKSYGMWMVPPDVGSTVLVMFLANDPKRGFWIGCVPKEDAYMNFMMPGLAATSFNVEDGTADNKGRKARLPTAEYNKKVADNSGPQDPTTFLKPTHKYFSQVLEKQGLLLDDTRGITTSSARREVPSSVFGISTPGPIDVNGKTGRLGTADAMIPDAPISRLGGSTFVMDDGHNKYLRKTSAGDGPPEYASVEDGETDGDPTIPHNELIRLRTRSGHQILMHTSEDLIYITNSRGTSWIEMTSDGKIDIYAQDSISVRTQNDFNFYADRDINMECVRNFNLKVGGNHSTEVVGNKQTIVTGNVANSIKGTYDETIVGATKLSVQGAYLVLVNGGTKITTTGTLEMNTSGNHIETAAQIHMNGPAAGKATAAKVPTALKVFTNPTETDGSTLQSIMLRVPTTEPYPHHENLDPASFKPSKTDRG